MVFKRLLTFERSASGLLTEADVMELEIALMLRPEAGALIPGGKGLRKLRRPLARPRQEQRCPRHLLLHL